MRKNVLTDNLQIINFQNKNLLTVKIFSFFKHRYFIKVIEN